ncbi:hypothetical protein LCI18_006639 [Fusarium solani-melongenae]|uniref:Uncharacterized protein n=1 Tax=Fusarium solani subsp. cucurbitae TaxID=2747967 RepID=A0ACD3Z357_FUSSC|nr:hypothetical protein LCI18_006639 [Fusarium solani-melongenae]
MNTVTTSNGIQEGFRQYLPEPDKYPLSGLDTSNVYTFSKAAVADPRVRDLFQTWADSLKTPFYGVTTDGVKVEDLFTLQDQGAPTATATIAANRLIDVLTPDEKLRALHDLGSEDWRQWCNTEIIAYDIGLRLEALQPSQIDLVWALVEASLSETGYAKVRGATKMNKFLGDLAGNATILNENSYFFMVFGRPSQEEPWGFSLSGHHLCLHVFFVANQMAIGPVFIGTEPNVIDEGPDKGVDLFRSEVTMARQLMQSITPEQQKKAQKTSEIHQPETPGWNIVDQRHLGGTGKDNAIIPYEGLVASELVPEHQDLLVSVIAASQNLLPRGPLEHYLRQVRQHLSETYFTWTGAFGDKEAFYFRIQSPVVLVELDHHSGIYLTNQTPDKYHIHTIHRLPNGGDYGQELIRKWKQKNPGKRAMKRMEYVRPFDEEATVDSGFPRYRVQILSSLESAIILASHIGEGGCGPGLHYHHSDQMYFMLRGTMTARLGDQVHDVPTSSLVFIPAGLPHRNWNDGPGSETHLEMIIPAPHRLKQLAYMVEKPDDVPAECRTNSEGYVRPIDAKRLAEPLPGFKIMPLADPSSGSTNAVIMYVEVEPNMGGPGTHVHEFDQYYFVLEGELTIEVALQKYVVTADKLVVIPAGVPHRQYNQGDVVERHVVINTPAPEPGRAWDYGVRVTPNGDNHYGNLNAVRELDDGALLGA